MKKSVLLTLALCSAVATNALANMDEEYSTYINLDNGVAWSKIESADCFATYALRASLGERIGKYFAIETGFGFLPSKKIAESSERDTRTGITESARFKLSSFNLDLMAKGILPLGDFASVLDGLELFAKLGAAWMHSRTKVDVVINDGERSVSKEVKDHFNNIHLAYGAGLAYNFNENFTLNIGWNGMFGKIDDAKRTTNMVMLGLQYNF